jgi:CrcB protein
VGQLAGGVGATLQAVPRRIDRMAAASRQVGMRVPATRSIGLVALGGALGALARVAVAAALPTAPGGWPWATMTANVTGALLLGLVLGIAQDAVVVGRWVRPLVGTGIVGGYTTFSTMSVETLELAAGGQALAAAGYAVVSAAAGLVAIWAGSTAARTRRHGWGGR